MESGPACSSPEHLLVVQDVDLVHLAFSPLEVPCSSLQNSPSWQRMTALALTRGERWHRSACVAARFWGGTKEAFWLWPTSTLVVLFLPGEAAGRLLQTLPCPPVPLRLAWIGSLQHDWPPPALGAPSASETLYTAQELPRFSPSSGGKPPPDAVLSTKALASSSKWEPECLHCLCPRSQGVPGTRLSEHTPAREQHALVWMLWAMTKIKWQQNFAGRARGLKAL